MVGSIAPPASPRSIRPFSGRMNPGACVNGAKWLKGMNPETLALCPAFIQLVRSATVSAASAASGTIFRLPCPVPTGLQSNMDFNKNYKRSEELSPVEVQRGNYLWWTRNPMAYDWDGKIKLPRFSPDWYKAIDAETLYGHRLFASLEQPFDQILPIPELRGARVLEIGCGMGLHTQTMAAAGAEVTAIDMLAGEVPGSDNSYVKDYVSAVHRVVQA